MRYCARNAAGSAGFALQSATRPAVSVGVSVAAT